jgi:hypothetical protein
LPVLDPSGRELVISCGAALFHLRAALAARGIVAAVQDFPEVTEPDLLARVSVTAGESVLERAMAERLVGVVPRRRTNRHDFRAGVPGALVDVLRDAAEREGAVVVPMVSVEDRTLVKVWQQVADATQAADPAYRHELAQWVGEGRTTDGIDLAGTATAAPNDLAPRDFAFAAQGRIEVSRDQHDTLVLVLATLTDEPTAWLHAGQALARLWLEATAAGVALQPLSQAVENPTARVSLRQDLRLGTYWPQLVLRGGYAPEQPATPRRPLDDVLGTG